MPNPRGINQYTKGRGRGASKSKSPWAAPDPRTRISGAGPSVAPSRAAASRAVKKIANSSGSRSARAKAITKVLGASGVSGQVGSKAHQAFVEAQLAKKDRAKKARAKKRK